MSVLIYESRWVVRYFADDEMTEVRERYKVPGLALSELESQWESWTRLDQVDFLHAFLNKPSLDPGDEAILKFLCLRFPIRPVHYTHWQERGELSADFHPRL